MLLGSSAAHAQWQIVAPALLGNISYWGGSIIYKDGIVWAGVHGLWRSNDTGTTWTNVLPPTRFALGIVDIAFFDRQTGLIAVKDSGVFRTQDGGSRWKRISDIQASNVAFGDSPQEIYLTESYSAFTSARCYKTNDGGLNWNTSPINQFIPGLVVHRGGRAYAFAGERDTRLGSIYASTDRGATWLQRAGMADWDCYSLTVDSCDENLMFLSNENQISDPFDNLSTIYVTTDGGASWQMPQSYVGKFFSGSIQTSGNAIYAQTVANGVYRSTDRGSTFLPIGGPVAAGDTRTLSAIGDNIIIAADSLGNMWRTMNSGGDSLRTSIRSNLVELLPATSVVTDTVSACDTLTRYVFLLRNSLCAARTLLDQSITGADQVKYKFQKQASIFFATGDSIILSFHPDAARTYHAFLRVKFSDGTIDSLPLSNVATEPRSTLSLSDSVLFQFDSVSLCDTTRLRSVVVHDAGCFPRSILQSVIGGDSSSHYLVTTRTTPGLDTFLVQFYGGEGVDYPARLDILLSDSARFSISLRGHGVKATHYTSILPRALFIFDTLSSCSDAIIQRIVLHDSSCPTRLIDSQFVTGPDSARYTILIPFGATKLANDTATISLQPQLAGDYHGFYVIQFHDGARDTIKLFGSVRPTPLITLASADLFVDTLGGTAYVPIRIKNTKPGDKILAIMHFDTTMLVYKGTFAQDGSRIDQLSSEYAGRASFQIDARDTSTTAFSLFEVFPIDSACSTLTFDSIEYISHGGTCMLQLPSSLSSQICTNLGCGTRTLSRFTRYKAFPKLSITPNPSRGPIALSSDMGMSNTRITLLDMKGVTQFVCTRDLLKEIPDELDLSRLADGVYFICVENLNGRIFQRIVKRSR